MTDDLPVRKKLRLENYDYGQNGAYFITVCIKDRHELLGEIVNENAIVGDAVLCVPDPQQPPHIQLTEIGEFVKEFLENMNTANEKYRLENYVIMPNHVHLLVTLKGAAQESGTLRTASPTIAHPKKALPTKALIPQIVHGLKVFTTKRVGEAVWQRSYYDHIVRNEDDYEKIWNYIDTNNLNWQIDRFYNKT